MHARAGRCVRVCMCLCVCVVTNTLSSRSLQLLLSFFANSAMRGFSRQLHLICCSHTCIDR